MLMLHCCWCRQYLPVSKGSLSMNMTTFHTSIPAPSICLGNSTVIMWVKQCSLGTLIPTLQLTSLDNTGSKMERSLVHSSRVGHLKRTRQLLRLQRFNPLLPWINWHRRASVLPQRSNFYTYFGF